MQSLTTPAAWLKFLKRLAGDGAAWPGVNGATEEELLAAEKRLKVKFPPSFRSFLAASNGWQKASRAIPVLRAAQKLRWFNREHKEWVQAYTAPMQDLDLPLPAEAEYFSYTGESQASFDPKHLVQTLCISEVGDSAVILLNPMVVWPDGEWEAWFLANWLPGVLRYRFFADWFQQEAADQRGETFEPAANPDELPTVYKDGPAKANRRIRPREEVLTLDQIRKRLQSKTRSHRVKAVQSLCRMGGPEAIAILIDLLQNDYDFHVRCDAAESLGKLRATEAIEPLIALTIEYTRVTNSAVHSLKFFNDERSAQCLLHQIEANRPSVGGAALAMAVRKDSRAVKPLLDLLVSKEPKKQHTGNIAARFISQFEEAGFAALEPLVTHADEEIRRRAIVGIWDIACLSKIPALKKRACAVLEQCLAREAGGRMHQWLSSCVAVACNKQPDISDNPFANG